MGSFLTFLGKAVVHERNSDAWEFGKGASSELRFCGVAVLQSGRGQRLEAESKNVKWSNLWEDGKTSSERESKIFSSNLGNEGFSQAIFAVKRTLKWSKKDF